MTGEEREHPPTAEPVSTGRRVRVLVADDHAIIRTGLRHLFATVEDVELVGEATDGAHAAELVDALDPDVVLMDISMPNVDGIEATRRIVASGARAQIVVLTSLADQQHIVDALDAGAVGYLFKHADPDDIIRAVRTVVEGGAPLDPKVARVLLASRRDLPPAVDAPHTAPHAPTQPATEHGLTPREREVLAAVSAGLANKHIARRLGISERTVKAHLTSVFARIGVTDRTQAALWARDNLPD